MKQFITFTFVFVCSFGFCFLCKGADSIGTEQEIVLVRVDEQMKIEATVFLKKQSSRKKELILSDIRKLLQGTDMKGNFFIYTNFEITRMVSLDEKVSMHSQILSIVSSKVLASLNMLTQISNPSTKTEHKPRKKLGTKVKEPSVTNPERTQPELRH